MEKALRLAKQKLAKCETNIGKLYMSGDMNFFIFIKTTNIKDIPSRIILIVEIKA
jgi:hypothetical protein